VWPAELSSRPELVRVGARAVERWRGRAGALELLARQPLDAFDSTDPGVLADAVARVMHGAPANARPRVIVESAWMPVVAVECGAIWRPRDVAALLRHRFEVLHRPADAAGAWPLRCDYRVGDAMAVGFATAPALLSALDQAALAWGGRWRGIHPALAWGLRVGAPRAWWRRPARWLVWPEQDRTIVVRRDARGIAVLNPCAALAGDGARLARLVEIERLRAGLVADAAPIHAAAWDGVERAALAAARLHWTPLAGAGMGAPA